MTGAVAGFQFTAHTMPHKAAAAPPQVSPLRSSAGASPLASRDTRPGAPASSSVASGVASATTDTTTSNPLVAPPPTSASPPTVGVVLGTPARISVPSVGINESVMPDGLNNQGDLEPPPGQVIWYNHTPLPGSVGSSLIAGHDEWSGPSSFWNLDEVPAGQAIFVTYTSGQTLKFVVVSGKSELKTNVQNDASIWASHVDFPQLVVITCDKHSPVVDHHHLSNYIVYTTLSG